MDERMVAQAIMQGNLVECSEEDYKNKIRHLLHQLAGNKIDQSQDIYAMIALNEIKRLDNKFNFGFDGSKEQ